MPAIREEVEQAEEEGISFEFLRTPVGFLGQGRVSHVELAEVDLGPPDADGRPSPLVSTRRQILSADHVLLALGQSADLGLVPSHWTLAGGRFWDGDRGLQAFAAGDLATGDGTVAHVLGDGRRAATRALRSLGVEIAEFTRPDRAGAVPVTDIRLDQFERHEPAADSHLPVPSRRRSWAEVNAGLQDGSEAARCFSCGHCTLCDTCLVYCPDGVISRTATGYSIDTSYCKGCGICVAECPRKGMEMGTNP